jgi:Domain of unknown function (DUF4373)
MARPIKTGLSYFPLDVDFHNDIKLRKLVRQKDGRAISVYLILLCSIYKNGYYLEWDEDLAFIIAESTGYPEDYILEVIHCCLEVGLFCKIMFEQHHIFTSHGIQIRYKTVCKTYNKTALITKYNIIKSQETPIKSEETPIKSELSTQRKEKEIKENKRKEKEQACHVPPTPKFFIEINELADFLMTDQAWCEIIAMQNQIGKTEELFPFIHQFVDCLKSRGENGKSPKDAKQHFANWYNIEKWKLKTNGTDRRTLDKDQRYTEQQF